MANGEKQRLFDGFATIAKALAAGRRAELVDLLANGERTVDQLASELGQSPANTSQHLQVLARAGLVTSRRDGNRVWYRLAGPEVEQFWLALQHVAATRLPALDRLAAEYLGDRTGIDEVSADDLDRLLAGGAELWDVRPADEYHAGHLPGARSVPPDAIDDCVAALATDAEVVAYCRGPYCVFADDAVRTVVASGRRAHRLTTGVPQWRLAGGAIASGAPGHAA